MIIQTFYNTAKFSIMAQVCRVGKVVKGICAGKPNKKHK